ncbi:FYVE, RhoGEF and PH domain-containing protein 6 isoform X1 [Tetranychus urticae]|uniref:FYVE, RhoGEF and PH domain-containing protein 6 n=1 Tax=Tetranychus urticae TaxID=32264 RepID=T1KLJ3_TETUR|nr:FYVE, RhoGEF and PH domain-containing protein 6 isoform X1 [Tetranychus urticae]
MSSLTSEGTSETNCSNGDKSDTCCPSMSQKSDNKPSLRPKPLLTLNNNNNIIIDGDNLTHQSDLLDSLSSSPSHRHQICVTSTSSISVSKTTNTQQRLPCRPAPGPPSTRSSISSVISSTGSLNGVDGELRRSITPRATTPKPPVPVKPAHLRNLRFASPSPPATLKKSNSKENESTGIKQSSHLDKSCSPKCTTQLKCLPEKASPPQSRKIKEQQEDSLSDNISISPELRRKSSSVNGTIGSFLHPHSTIDTPISSEEEFSDSRSIGSTNSIIIATNTEIDGGEKNINPEEEMKKRQERKLFLVAQELTKTEEDFVNNMVLLLDFREHIRNSIPEEIINSIFRYVPELHEYHKQLAEEFRNRINKWESNPKIADVLIIMGPFLKPHAPYTKEFTSMVTTLEEATKKYPGFADALKEFEKTDRCNKLLVRHYMHKPVQRLPQYKLILEKYQTYLTEDHPDYKDTLAAIELVSKIADFANDFVRKGDSSSKLLKIQTSLVRSYEIIKPGRVLLKDGELDKLSRHEPQPRLFLLCNDCLIYLTALQQGTVYKLNHELSLEGMRVQVPDHQQFQNEFSIISPSRSISVAAKTPAECASWIEAIKKAIKDYETRRNTFNTSSHGDRVGDQVLLGFEAPLWIPDTRVTMCQICSAEFTVTFRRHHCRACGKVVCNDCSSNKAPLRYLKFRAARVCDQCFPVLQDQMTKKLTISMTTALRDHGASSDEVNDDLVDDSGSVNSNGATSTGSTVTPSNFDLDNLKAQFVRIPLGLRSSGRRKSLPQRLKEVSADDKNCSISGYLMYKKNYKKSWKKAWFVVKEKVLYRFKESNDTAALQSLPILGYQVQLVTDGSIDSSEAGLIFQLSHPGQNTILFKTLNQESASRWIQEILSNTQL